MSFAAAELAAWLDDNKENAAVPLARVAHTLYMPCTTTVVTCVLR